MVLAVGDGGGPVGYRWWARSRGVMGMRKQFVRVLVSPPGAQPAVGERWIGLSFIALSHELSRIMCRPGAGGPPAPNSLPAPAAAD